MPEDSTRRMSRWHITFNSPVILCFVALCVAVMVLDQLTAGASTNTFFVTYRGSLANPLTYVRLLTHVLGHSGWDHLVGNMTYILLLGPLLEEKYGSRVIAEVIALTALACGIVNAVLFPHAGLLGASGVVFAFILMSSLTSLREGEIPLTFVLVAVLFLGNQVLEGVFVRDNVANLSHIIGGIVGAATGFAFASSGR